ncbi:MAG: hypothetical protein F4Y73_11975 [Gemmatimonadetes bacterium]|nr:hypothetical protein [Gemmatimonadota bacterium]
MYHPPLRHHGRRLDYRRQLLDGHLGSLEPVEIEVPRRRIGVPLHQEFGRGPLPEVVISVKEEGPAFSGGTQSNWNHVRFAAGQR